MSAPASVKLIDRRGQRFGAGLSAITLIAALAIQVPLVAPLVGLALAVSAARGTRWFLFGRPWPLVRDALRLGPPVDPEPEIPPRFAQALGATALGLATVAFLVAPPVGWGLVVAVAALQTVLAVTGYCVGCRLYGLQWFIPAAFDRLVGTEPALKRTKLQRVA